MKEDLAKSSNEPKTSPEGLQRIYLQYFSKEVPAVGIEPTLPKEHDFESRASTNSATPAFLEAGGVFISRGELSRKRLDKSSVLTNPPLR